MKQIKDHIKGAELIISCTGKDELGDLCGIIGINFPCKLNIDPIVFYPIGYASKDHDEFSFDLAKSVNEEILRSSKNASVDFSYIASAYKLNFDLVHTYHFTDLNYILNSAYYIDEDTNRTAYQDSLVVNMGEYYTSNNQDFPNLVQMLRTGLSDFDYTWWDLCDKLEAMYGCDYTNHASKPCSLITSRNNSK